MQHATFKGPSGSGKTLMMGSTTRIVIRKVSGKILLIVLSSGGNLTLEQLHNYLFRAGNLTLVQHQTNIDNVLFIMTRSLHLDSRSGGKFMDTFGKCKTFMQYQILECFCEFGT